MRESCDGVKFETPKERTFPASRSSVKVAAISSGSIRGFGSMDEEEVDPVGPERGERRLDRQEDVPRLVS